MSLTLKNLILFKAGWAACVLGAANGMAWLGAAAVAAIALEHLRTARVPGREISLLAIAAGLGLVWESTLVSLGLLDYGSGNFLTGFAPYWIVAMWVLFATTLNVGMKWLKRHWLLAAMAGGIGGPMAFFAGERSGAVTFAHAPTALAAIAVGWAVLLPLLTALADRLDGHGDLMPAQPARS